MALITTVLLPPGLLAARPAFGQAGRVYYATDAVTLTYDTGLAWVTYAPGAGGGGGRPGDDYYGNNLIKNSPGEIFGTVTDGTEPQWWDESSGNATLTDEDTAGEVPPDIHQRCFKCVTIANDEYGYQTFTLANEEVLDAGVTIVSFGCWVYCATGAKASIGIFGTNLTLQESAQAGGGAWEWLEVNNITLNAADATIQVRLIVDTDTAWFTMPMFAVGPVAQPWIPRGLKYRPIAGVVIAQYNPTGDIAWSNLDCTAVTDSHAAIIHAFVRVLEPNGTIGSTGQIGHDTAITAEGAVIAFYLSAANGTWGFATSFVMCDDSQVIRHFVNEVDADNDMNVIFGCGGYWRWN